MGYLKKEKEKRMQHLEQAQLVLLQHC